MFNVIENGTLVEIPDNAFGFVFKCWIPPFGYGINIVTGKIEKTDIWKRSDDELEQFWERRDLPSDYKEKRRKEESRQKYDSNYVDPYLENIRREEWGRRIRGVWFYNKGIAVYLTQLHYFYLNWWKYQGIYLSFREPDLDTFYSAQYCMEDPCALGLNEITMRKSGKTARSGCCAYERTSRINNHHCGLQSKTDPDAWEVFKKAIVHPWRKLPHFFRPIYDLMKGDDPNDELRFFHTSRRGSTAKEEQLDDALESWIDFKPSDASAYDGPQLETYICDEVGKTRRDVSVKERQNTTRYCTERDGQIFGFHWFTTTVEVEEDEEENEEFQELTANSNPLVKNENGMTISGLYTIFQPAYRYMFTDKYGKPDEERAKVYLMNARKKLEEEGKLRELSSLKRKQPMTFREAFAADGNSALYNAELLNYQIDNIIWRNDLIERGNLEWEGGYRLLMEIDINGILQENPSKIKWVPNPNGRWTKVKDWMPKEENKVSYINGKFIPNNNFAIRMGCDPFKFDKTKDKRRSDCVAYGYQVKDELFPSEFDDMFVLEYAYRTETTRESNEDILKMAWWLGCKVLFERNVNHWKGYFQDNNCMGFLMFLPLEEEPGIYTDGKGTVVQAICNYTSAYINDHVKKCFFRKLMQKDVGWLGFKVEETQKYDRPMAAGFTLISVKGMKVIKSSSRNRNIEDIMPQRKAS